MKHIYVLVCLLHVTDALTLYVPRQDVRNFSVALCIYGNGNVLAEKEYQTHLHETFFRPLRNSVVHVYFSFAQKRKTSYEDCAYQISKREQVDKVQYSYIFYIRAGARFAVEAPDAKQLMRGPPDVVWPTGVEFSDGRFDWNLQTGTFDKVTYMDDGFLLFPRELFVRRREIDFRAYKLGHLFYENYTCECYPLPCHKGYIPTLPPKMVYGIMM